MNQLFDFIKILKSFFVAVIPILLCMGCQKVELFQTANEISRLQIRQINQNTVPVGKSFVVMPLNSQEVKSDVNPKAENILFLILMDGKPMNYEKDIRILMYAKQGDETPIYSFTAQEWKKMHVITHCSADLLSYIQNADAGDALFCNHSISLEKVHYFVAREGGEKGDAATSYVVNFEKPNLSAISLAFD
jgi:hypothetical protein